MKNLKVARERWGLTQVELAERLNTTQQTVAHREAGKAEPNLATLRDLAMCLHLLGGSFAGPQVGIGKPVDQPARLAIGRHDRLI
jgi:DNA-binding XRE family transcriptional regulator